MMGGEVGEVWNIKVNFNALVVAKTHTRSIFLTHTVFASPLLHKRAHGHIHTYSLCYEVLAL